MTLETAKQLVKSGEANKEAEAVVRGGMTICETKDDGSRKYHWIKVEPTTTDTESSIKLAMDKYDKKNQVKRRAKQKDPATKETASSTPKTDEETIVVNKEIDNFMNRLKKKAKKIWEEIDSIVIE